MIKEASRLELVQEYYFSRKLLQIAEMRNAGNPVINLGIGSPDLKPSQESIDRLYQVANQDNAHGYQSYRGIPALRDAIAKYYKSTYNVDADTATEILPLIGSKEGIMHISMAFIDPGDEVLIPNPGYPTYQSANLLAGAKIRYYDLEESRNWEIDFEKLENQNLSKVKILWLNYPNMPTGSDASDDFFGKLIQFAKAKNILICNDNPYSMVLNPNPKSLLKFDPKKEYSLELNSLSKSHNMAGWRLGYIIANKSYINSVLKFKSNMDSGIFLAMQEAAIVALQNDAQWHAQRNEIYKNRRTLVYDILDHLGCKYDKNQVGMFIWAKIPDLAISSEDFSENILQKAHVFMTPGFIFGSNGERYVRISLTNTESDFIESLKRIKTIIK